MVLKRRLNELWNDEPESSRQRLSALKLFDGITTEKIESIFEPILRKTVREAVDNSFLVLFPARSGVSSISHDEPRRGWMLRFVNQPPPKFFTGNKVEDKDGAPLKLEIVDVDSKTIVLDGPLSALKLEIVALNGDFNADQHEDMGENYFNSDIVLAREGKKPLVTGEIRTSLKNGVAFIRDVCFTDNSRWTRSGKFRLGIRVLQSSCKGFGVREAVSDAFKVKDRRGEACMKHLHPSLNDEVWRLRKIRRNGIFHQRLVSIGITTVEEFLQMLDADPSFLKEKLKCGNSNRIWDAIVKHATTCVSHDKGHYKDHKITLKSVCSNSCNLGVGVYNDKPNSRTSPRMYSFQQVADDLEGYTVNNGINQVQFDRPIYSSSNLQSEPLIPPGPSLCLDIPVSYSDSSTDQQGHELARLVPSPSKGYELVNHMEDLPLNPAPYQPQVDSFFATPSTGTSHVGSSCWLMNDDPLDVLIQPTDHHTPLDDIFQTDPPTWPSPLLWRQFSASFGAPISESETTLFSCLAPNNGSTKTAWCKLRAVVMLHILIKQRRVGRAKKATANSVLCKILK